MTETRRGSVVGGGDAEVDAIRTVVEGRRRNRGRQGTEAQLDLPDPATRRGRKHALVLPIPSVQERGPRPCGCAGRRRSSAGEDASASNSNDTGSGSSMTKTQSAGRRPYADG